MILNKFNSGLYKYQDLHVRLDRQMLQQMRVKLYLLGITTQDLFGELAELVVNDDAHMARVIEKVCSKKFKTVVNNILHKKPAVIPQQCELDPDAMYKIIQDPDVKVNE